MYDTCYQVITWLQTLTVASVMLNFLLVGLVAIAWWDVRTLRGGKDVQKPKPRPWVSVLLSGPTHDPKGPGKPAAPAPWYPE